MIKVAVMGCGTVGKGVMEMLGSNRDAICRAVGQEVQLGWALDIRKPDELPEGTIWTDRFDDLLNDDTLTIAAEAIGGAGVTYQFTRALLERGVSVVTSNKELIATRGEELMGIAAASGAKYLFEASVGGGMPIIRPMRCDLGANHITEILGIVNGSTNYLLTRMEQDRVSFPVALAEAQAMGYAEADPSADVDGHDARRKLAILAHVAFGAALSDEALIETTGIGQITDRDIACANALGGSIKLLVSAQRDADGWRGWVGPALVDRAHPLCRVDGVNNGVMVTGDFVGPVMFQGQGAGSRPTASAVLSDIVEIARGAAPCPAPSAESAPRLVRSDAGSARMLTRVELSVDDGELRSRIAKFMPDVAVKALQGGMVALMTPLMPALELHNRFDAMQADGLRLGARIRLLQRPATFE